MKEMRYTSQATMLQVYEYFLAQTLRTPLHSAAMFHNFSSMKALVDAGADVNSETQVYIHVIHVSKGQSNLIINI